MKKNWKKFNQYHLDKMISMNNATNREGMYSFAKLLIWCHDNPEFNYQDYYNKAISLCIMAYMPKVDIQVIGFCLTPQTV